MKHCFFQENAEGDGGKLPQRDQTGEAVGIETEVNENKPEASAPASSTSLTSTNTSRTVKRMPTTTTRRSQFHQAPTFCQRSLNIFSTTSPSRTSPATSFTTTLHSSCTTKRTFLATPMTKFHRAWTNQRWRRGIEAIPAEYYTKSGFRPITPSNFPQWFQRARGHGLKWHFWDIAAEAEDSA